MKGSLMLKKLTWLIYRPKVVLPRHERRWRKIIGERERTIEELTQHLHEREEDLRKLESIHRIQQIELDELSAVVARNLERVKAETRELGGAVMASSGAYRLPHAPQENETDA
jgi:hypothetical protein